MRSEGIGLGRKMDRMDGWAGRQVEWAGSSSGDSTELKPWAQLGVLCWFLDTHASLSDGALVRPLSPQG